MTWLAKVIEHSRCLDSGCSAITMQLRYPRFIHAEFMTHRMFSRNASSSRAIPVAKMIEQVRNEPAMPVHWGKNQAGMQAREELDDQGQIDAVDRWSKAASDAARHAEHMMALGLHKQVANRVLEPFQWMNVIVTATEWDNFFDLRDHADADPNIQHLARMMKQAIVTSAPRQISVNKEKAHGWHLPYVTTDERLQYWDHPLTLAQLSTARCARVSYLTHEGKAPELAKDLDLYQKLVGSHPIHASPTEHPCFALPAPVASKNFIGFCQHRVAVEKKIHKEN